MAAFLKVEKMKVVFMGTPDFAVPVLERLIKEHEVVCVYTREPKVAGRGNKVTKTPVHLVAEKYKIEVRTPKTLKDEKEQEAFRKLNADISVVAAYGLILPKVIIEAFEKGCINVHASLLPRWRGAAPIQRSIEFGDKKSGVTIMQVVEALDAGAMYKKGEVEITSLTTGGDLHDKLSTIGADLMSEVLADFDNIIPVEQDESLVTYASKLDKDESRIDFNLEADVLERKIRAFNPFPAMFFEYQGERFKVLQAQITDMKAKAGEIIESEKSLIIGCKDKALSIKQIQRQGKKPMQTEELLRGFCFCKGTVL